MVKSIDFPHSQCYYFLISYIDIQNSYFYKYNLGGNTMQVITYNDAQKMSSLKLLELARNNLAIVSEFQEQLPPKFTYTIFHVLASEEIISYIAKKTGWKALGGNFFMVADIEENVITKLEKIEIPLMDKGEKNEHH